MLVLRDLALLLLDSRFTSMALSPPMTSPLWLLLRLNTLLLVVVNPLAQLALLLPQPQQSPTLPPQLLPPHLQSLLPQPLLLLQLLPPSMVDTLLLPQPMADMLALDTLVLLPPLVLDSQPPLMLLDNSTQLPSPTCMMLPEMLAVMLPLLLKPTSTMPLVMLVAMMPLLPLSTSTRRSPLRSMCMTHLARPIQQLSPTSTLSPLLPPSPLLPQPLPPPQQLLLPLPSPLPQLLELSAMELDTEPDTEPSLVEPSLVVPLLPPQLSPLPLPQLPLPRLLPPQP